jgi:hypothetical protein
MKSYRRWLLMPHCLVSLLVVVVAGVATVGVDAEGALSVQEAVASVIQAGVRGEPEATWEERNREIQESRQEALETLWGILGKGEREEKRVALQTISWIGGGVAHTALLGTFLNSALDANLRQSALLYLLGTSGFFEFTTAMGGVNAEELDDLELQTGIKRVQKTLSSIECDAGSKTQPTEELLSRLEEFRTPVGSGDVALARESVRRILVDALKKGTGRLPDGTRAITRPVLEETQRAEILQFGQAAIPALMEVIDSGSGFEVHLARPVLAEIGGRQTVAALVRVILEAKHPRANLAFLTLLEATSLESTLAALQEVAQYEEDTGLKELAASALCGASIQVPHS